MAITQARGLALNDIRCPGCGSVRTVDIRTARHWRAGSTTGHCLSCRGLPSQRVARERDIGYWLRLHGARIPKGQRPRQYLTASGMPQSLAEFARDCFPQ